MAEPLSRRIGDRRENHFNLMRFVASLVVIYTHSFGMTGHGLEPFERRFGISIGHLAVDLFFVLSGFLVSASLLVRRSLPSFALARALRIFPVLVVTAFGCAFVLGPLATELPVGEYLRHPATWTFAFQNSITWPMGVQFSLPGVFEHLPMRGAVNGSLWTLPWELSLYLALFGLGLLALAGPRPLGERWLARALVVVAVVANVACTIYEDFHFPYQFHVTQTLRLSSLFFGGATMFVLADRVPHSRRLALLALAVLVVELALGRPLMIVYTAAITYLVIWMAYARAPALAAYNRFGDYSYGTYLYGFPLTQCVVAAVPGIPPAGLVLLGVPLTLLFAVPSWHFLEERALRLKPTAGRREARAG